MTLGRTKPDVSAARAKRIAASDDHRGARVVTGKSAARIPAPERHDRLTVAAASEREVNRPSHHGDTRARPQEAQLPRVEAFASTGSGGVAEGLPEGAFVGIRRQRAYRAPGGKRAILTRTPL